MRSFSPRFILPIVFAASTCAPAQPSAAPPEGSNWAHVKALPQNTYLHVYTSNHHAICYLTAVDAESMSCLKDTGVGHKPLSFQRNEIRAIRLARRGRSALLGAAVLGGAGAVAGGIQSTQSKYFAVKGAWAMVYGFSGAFAGAPIGYLADFSSATVYLAPKP